MSKKNLNTLYRINESNAIRAEAGSSPDKMTIIWSTGFKGLRQVWDEKFYEELDMSVQACDLSRLNSGAPILIQHDQDARSVIGVIEKAWIENGIGKAEVRFSKRDDVKGLVQDINDGIIRNTSVGYKVTEYTDVSLPTDEIRTLRATKWQPMEVSMVAIGFDPYSQTQRSLKEENENEVSIITNKKEENQMTEEELKRQEEEKAEQAKKDAEAEALKLAETEAKRQADETLKIEEEKKKAVEAFKEKSAQIRNAVKAAGLEDGFADSLIERSLEMSDATNEIFKKLEENKNVNLTNKKEEKQMTKREMAEQALLNRVDAKKHKIDSTNPYKQARFIDIIEAVVERNKGESESSFVKRALVTSDLAQLLSNVSNKLLATEGPEAFSYSKWTSPITLRDYKETPIVTLGAYNLQAKTEGGDYAEASLVDSDEKITLRERGVRFSISQKAIINDDLGALKQLPSKAQAAGFRDIEKTVYGILNSNPTMSDSKTLFHADHGNLIATGGVGPTIEGVAAANLKFAAMTDNNGEVMDLRTKYLVVPPALELVAKQTAGAIVSSEAGKVNPYAGEIEVIVSARLTASDAWYAVCDKDQLASIVTATLEGVSEPMVSTDENFRSSNMEMKVEFPNAAAAASYKGIIKTVVE